MYGHDIIYFNELDANGAFKMKISEISPRDFQYTEWL